MKKLFSILIVILAFVSFYSCDGDASANDVVEQNLEIYAENMPEFVFSGGPFKIPNSRFTFKILVDKKTRVQYALLELGYITYGIPLIDSDGKPDESLPEFVFSSNSFTIPDSRFSCKVLVNKKTRVQYILINSGRECYGFPLIDSVGKPILYIGDWCLSRASALQRPFFIWKNVFYVVLTFL